MRHNNETLSNTTPSKPLAIPSWLSANFLASQQSLNGAASNPINEIRKKAFENLNTNGFASVSDEEWKYTNVKDLIKNKFELAKSESADTFKQKASIVFINGEFSEGLSTIKNSDTLKFSRLNQEKELTAEYFGKISQPGSFVDLNTALAKDGIVLEATGEVTDTIEILYHTSGDSLIVNPRLLVVARESSKLEILERFTGSVTGGAYLNNYVAEFVVEANAKVKHYKIQEEDSNSYHFSRIDTKQADKGIYENHCFNFGSKLARNEINPVLNGEYGFSLLHGLNILDAEQHVDNHTVLDHALPNCDSNEWYKGIYNDKSTGIFSGTIIVREDAQKTNAFQSNQSLLLSDDSESYSKPQLKIWADDVKCSHGATVGELDSEAMFYLRSRGIPEQTAKGMLIRAFANDILEPIEIESFKQEIEKKIIEKLSI